LTHQNWNQAGGQGDGLKTWTADMAELGSNKSEDTMWRQGQKGRATSQGGIGTSE